ncbi:MAG: hypothetical protein WCE54_05835 [Ignavibacteriaceae bacterium]
MRFILVPVIVLTLVIKLYPQQSTLSKGVNYLSEFIASDYFLNLKKTNNDLELADTLFLRAVKYKDYNYSEALLALTFATVPYKEVPIQFPLIGILDYPLVSANDSVFLVKDKNLPKDFFYDTPKGSFGDKDKLAHFFGSAFISYSSNIFDLGDLIGYFVEVFEQSFKVQSSVDTRDLRTNKLGNIFGDILKKNENALPSQVMLMKSLSYFSYNL